MNDAGRRGHPSWSLAARLSGALAWSMVVLLLLAGSASAAPRTTTFVHSVGFSFDYPSKWQVKRLDEGLLLTPGGVDRDPVGKPLEVIVIGFVDVGATDAFDPAFAGAFESHYRSLVPNLSRSGDMDWLKTTVGMGMLIPFEDRYGYPHRVYGAMHGELGIFLAHVARSDDVHLKTGAVRDIFASFRWTESAVDPALVRSWTDLTSQSPERAADRWVFADDGRLRRLAGEASGGFYSSSGGVLNIVWDHGIEESYLYEVSRRPEGGPQLELRPPDGEALRLH